MAGLVGEGVVLHEGVDGQQQAADVADGGPRRSLPRPNHMKKKNFKKKKKKKNCFWKFLFQIFFLNK